MQVYNFLNIGLTIFIIYIVFMLFEEFFIVWEILSSLLFIKTKNFFLKRFGLFIEFIEDTIFFK